MCQCIYMYMYIYIYIYIHIFVHMHIHIWVHTHTHTHIYIYIYLYIYIYIYVCIYMYVYVVIVGQAEWGRARAWEQGSVGARAALSHTMHQLNGFRKSTPPQNRQRNVLIGKSKQQVVDSVGGLTF